jgi:23S rRNA (uridine2552-2'-O)-methyltransferase
MRRGVGRVGRVIATDILPMGPLDGAEYVKGEVRDEAVLKSIQRVLKPGGYALIKVFQGSRLQERVAVSRRKFAKVRLSKPQVSRSRNPEMYLLAKDFLMV